jgi:hypothetical protein
MNPMTHVWAHLSFALLFAAPVTGLIRVAVKRIKSPGKSLGPVPGGDQWQPRTGRGWLRSVGLFCGSVVIGWATGLIPVGNTDLAGYVVAHSGELSFSTLFYLTVLVASWVSPMGAKLDSRVWDPARYFWAIAGLGLYATTLSGRGYDLYETGYGFAFAWLGLIFAAIAILNGRGLIAVWALGIVLCWQLKLAESVNFWDYAVDPFLFVGSSVHLIAKIRPDTARNEKEGIGTKSTRERKLLNAESGEVPADALGHALPSAMP